ncbi:SRPBCC family protein [Niabella insulamsoli]|uniref:SRPBCC family protein n=1 Tax=Niabella insulamsoli TaxID=3144874 RepID=UPI0031FCE8D3
MERKTHVLAEAGRQDIMITRSFDLPVVLLYEAYTTPDIIEQWMGTKVLQFELKRSGAFEFETSDPKGQVVFTAGGVHHELVEHQSIIRTFEMNMPGFETQLEFLHFEAVADASSKLTMQIIYRSPQHRERQLKLPFAFGLNMAHNRLQEIFDSLK